MRFIHDCKLFGEALIEQRFRIGALFVYGMGVVHDLSIDHLDETVARVLTIASRIQHLIE